MADSVLTLKPDVVVTVLEDSAVLLELQTKYFYSVNSTGWVIVQMLENGATRKKIKEQCLEWGAPDEDLDRIESFLDMFIFDNLLSADEGISSEVKVAFGGDWVEPVLEKHNEPLQRVMVSAFDPSLPLAE